MPKTPRIAVLLDENTSGDSSRYEAPKLLFRAIRDAGGVPLGIPYLPEAVGVVVDDFDGVLCGGGRFAYPDAWYLDGVVSKAPRSDRLDIEMRIVEQFQKRDKPILGVCAGMQLLACVNGCRLWADVQAAVPGGLEHDKPDALHAVTIKPDSRLRALVGGPSLIVNSRHREAVGIASDSVVVSARADDGVIEAIEVPAAAFAIGLQWHQEQFADRDHPGNRVFAAFVDACRQRRKRRVRKAA